MRATALAFITDGEALSRLLAKEPMHARQVSDPCPRHLRARAAACPRPRQTPAFAISQRAGRGGGTDRGPLAGKWCGHSSVVALSFRYLPLSRAGGLI
jgi:hypothetical protein